MVTLLRVRSLVFGSLACLRGCYVWIWNTWVTEPDTLSSPKTRNNRRATCSQRIYRRPTGRYLCSWIACGRLHDILVRNRDPVWRARITDNPATFSAEASIISHENSDDASKEAPHTCNDASEQRSLLLLVRGYRRVIYEILTKLGSANRTERHFNIWLPSGNHNFWSLRIWTCSNTRPLLYWAWSRTRQKRCV